MKKLIALLLLVGSVQLLGQDLTITQLCSTSDNFYEWTAENTTNKKVKAWFVGEDGKKKRLNVKAYSTFDFKTPVFWGSEYDLVDAGSPASFTAAELICFIDNITLSSICSDNPSKLKWKIHNPNNFSFDAYYQLENGEKRKIRISKGKKAKSKGDHGSSEYTVLTTGVQLGSTLTLSYGDDQEIVLSSTEEACEVSTAAIQASSSCDDVHGNTRYWTIENEGKDQVFVRAEGTAKWRKLSGDRDKSNFHGGGSSSCDVSVVSSGNQLQLEVYGGGVLTFYGEDCSPVDAPIYLSDASSGGPSDIYAVHLNPSGATADLQYLFTVEHGAHIAVNSTGTIMYLVGHGNLHSYDLQTRQLVRVGDLELNDVTQASMNPDNELWVVSGATNKAYQIDLTDGSIIYEVALAANPSGGDIVFTSSATLMAAGNKLVSVDLTDGSTDVINNLSDQTTGLAVLEEGKGDLLVSIKGQKKLLVVNPTTGVQSGTYDLYLDGAPFTLRWGDMATGVLYPAFDPCQMFLADKDTKKIYTVSSDGSTAHTTEVFDFPYDEVHIALQPTGEKLYVVRKNGSNKYGYFDFNDLTYTEVGSFNAGAITQLSFSPSGEMYFSVNGSNTIHKVTDISTGTHESQGKVKIDGTENFVNIEGADIAFDQDGSFYLGSSNHSGTVYTVSGMKDHLIAVPLHTFNKKITGLAIDSEGNLLASHYQKDFISHLDLSSLYVTQLAVAGDIQSTGWGDMTSACFELVDPCGGYASQVIEYNVGTLANGSGTPVAERMNPLNALGAPQENDVVNFVSLGFGGELIVELESPVYNHNKNGVYVENENSINYGEKSMADLIIVETSYGRRETNCGPNMDKNYPEKIMVYGKQSLSDGWVLLSSPEGECRSSFIDVQNAVDAGMSYVKYLKIVDVTNPQHFSSSSDGFDVDGIIICPDEVAAAISGEGRSAIANARTLGGAMAYDEEFFNRAPNDVEQEQVQLTSEFVYPNPSRGELVVKNSSSTVAIIVNVYNLEGRRVHTTDLKAAGKSTLDLSGNDPGVYIVEFRNGDHSEIQRIVIE